MTRTWVARIGLLIVFGALLVAGVGRAHADPIDTLTPAEIVWADHGGAVGICLVFDKYGVDTEVATQLVMAVHRVAGFALAPDSAYIVNYSVFHYCPRYWAALNEIGRQARSEAQQGAVV